MRQVFATLTLASPWLVLTLILFHFIGVWISCAKWRVLLIQEDIAVPFTRLVRWYIMGSFASNFLPTVVGGDAVRAFYAGRSTGAPVPVIRSILLERATGFLVLTVLACIGLLKLLQPIQQVAWVFSGTCIMITAIWGMILARPHCPPTVVARVNNMLPRSDFLRRRPQRILQIMLLSVVFQILVGIGAWVGLMAVHVVLPLSAVIFASALSNVLGVLPISLNGWGVRESAFLAMVAAYGLPVDGVFAGLLLARGLTVGCTVVGALPYFLEDGRAPGTNSSE
ncbi:MAG: hypothetical protein NVS2B7_40540 [Herpetosiphon sp.]